MAYVAAAVLAGGNVRVGLEDNLWLGKGVLATNAQLVERAVTIVETMGARVIGPDEVRKKLNLTKRAMAAAISKDAKFCPECGHEFKGNGWDGIDAHWRSKHEDIMPYDEAWPLLSAGKYGTAK